ncbi:hypothetical protein [Cecembia sp.]|uniref:hypothetical protein n=1 Tax=Cecembia sp. TaxID=1898110 RepID=UPI0025C09ED9|nr:hypothetical protein [Cecembia sp.]
MKRSVLGYFVLIFLLGSCAALKKGDKATDTFANYREDLDGTLITFPDLSEQAAKIEATQVGEEAVTVDQDLEFALDNFRERNRSERYWSGYTVLVYSGVDRDLAFKTRNDIYTDFETLKVEMQYQQPRYLVKVGRFINRIEAQAFYFQLKEQFPTARIIQDRFQREGYVNPEPIQDGER